MEKDTKLGVSKTDKRGIKSDVWEVLTVKEMRTKVKPEPRVPRTWPTLCKEGKNSWQRLKKRGNMGNYTGKEK